MLCRMVQKNSSYLLVTIFYHKLIFITFLSCHNIFVKNVFVIPNFLSIFCRSFFTISFLLIFSSHFVSNFIFCVSFLLQVFCKNKFGSQYFFITKFFVTIIYFTYNCHRFFSGLESSRFLNLVYVFFPLPTIHMHFKKRKIKVNIQIVFVLKL